MKKGVIAVISTIIGGIAGAAAVGVKSEQIRTKQKARIDKFYGYFHLVNQWLLIKNEGKSLTKYFEDNGYKKIAVYGMGELGNRLLEELKDSDIEIAYAIDRKAEKIYSDLKVVAVEEELAPVDAIIVTPIFMYDEIEELLMDKVNYPIISLEDVVFEVE